MHPLPRLCIGVLHSRLRNYILYRYKSTATSHINKNQNRDDEVSTRATGSLHGIHYTQGVLHEEEHRPTPGQARRLKGEESSGGGTGYRLNSSHVPFEAFIIG